MNADQRVSAGIGRGLHIALCVALAACMVGPAGITGCAPPLLGLPTEHEHCQPSFPDEDGWFGGDAAFSVALDGRSSLWFFGDSFVARRKNSEPAHARVYPFIHNSVGRSTCGPKGEWRIDYDWTRTKPPHAFFQPNPEAAWVKRAAAESGESPYYWPLSPFLLDGVLYVGLLRVQPADASGPFNLPFRLVGADLARIQNPTAPSDEWKVAITSLSDQTSAIPGSAWVVQDDYVYAFAYQNGADGRTPQFLARLPRGALSDWPADLSDHFETFSASREWIKGLAPNHAEILMDDDATEMSVHYSKAERTWLAVYSDPTPASEQAQKGVLWLRRAKSIEGPWSAPQPLAAVPEQHPRTPLASDPNLFCYAGKAHPQFGRAGELLVTYVCNLYARDEKEIPGTLERLRESPGIYRPRAMRIEIPPPADH